MIFDFSIHFPCYGIQPPSFFINQHSYVDLFLWRGVWYSSHEKNINIKFKNCTIYMYNFQNTFICLCFPTHSMISTECKDKLKMGNIFDFKPYSRNWSKNGDWKKGMRKPFLGRTFYIFLPVVEIFSLCIKWQDYYSWQLHKCMCLSQLTDPYCTLRNEFHYI